MKTRMLKIILSAIIVGSSSFSLLRAEEGTPSIASISDHLEEAIFLQEAKADLMGAIKKYQEILEAENVARSVAAEAQFRLAECYWAQGNKNQAQIEYQKVNKNYPENADWNTAANERLPQLFTPELSPFIEGERYIYEYVLPTGKTIGYSVATIKKTERDGRILWRRENQTAVGGQRLVFVEFDPITFNSVYSGMDSEKLGEITCTFGPEAKSATLEFVQKGDTKKFSFPQQIYDNEQAIELLRQLPAEPGHRGKLNIFVIFTGVQVSINYEVEEILNMDTVLGPRECYQVVLDLGTSKQRFYITNDAERLIVKMDAGVNINLTATDIYQAGTTNTYTGKDDNFSFQYPDEWVPIKEKGVIHFFISNSIAESSLHTNLNDSLNILVPGDFNATAKGLFEVEQKDNPEFALDESTLSLHKINGRDAVFFQGTRTENGEIVDQYVIGLILGTDKYVKVTLKAPARDWDRLEPEFYSIAQSMTE